MIYKIRSSTVPAGIIGSSDKYAWLEILDKTSPLQPGEGGYVNVEWGHPLGHNHTFSNTETITYDQQGRKVPNYCKHTIQWKPAFRQLDELCSGKRGYVPKWDYGLSSSPTGWQFTNNSVYTMRWLPNIPGWFDNGWEQVVGSELDDSSHLARAIADVRSGLLEPVFNLPRAIIELKDVSQTLKGIMSIMTFAARLGLTGGSALGSLIPSGLTGYKQYPQYHSAFQHQRRPFNTDKGLYNLQHFEDALKGSLFDVAGAYLTCQFGIRPTAADVKSFLGLKWAKNGGRTTQLEFTKKHIEYKAGQKLRVPYSLGGADGLPSLPVDRKTERIALLRDWHTDTWANAAVSQFLRLNTGCEVRRSIKGLVFAEVACDKTVDVPYEERMAYSGGFLSTIYEVTPWTWVVDSFMDVGKWLQTLERMSFPQQYRPVLKYGTWLSRSLSADLYIPVYENIGITHEIVTFPDPNSGYGAEVDLTYNIGRPKWKLAYQGSKVFTREPISAIESMLDLPPIRVPGRYTLGPMAALMTQLAVSGQTTSVHNSAL